MVDAEYLKIQMPTLALPVALSEIAEATTGSGDMLVEVPLSAPIRYRKAVQTIARFFGREGHYDSMPYSPYEQPENPEVVFMWLKEYIDVQNRQHRAVAYGACMFEVYGSTERPVPQLEWIWLHPFARREGSLSRAWPYFQKRFGVYQRGKIRKDLNALGIRLRPPLSLGMQAFLKSKQSYNNSDVTYEWITETFADIEPYFQEPDEFNKRELNINAFFKDVESKRWITETFPTEGRERNRKCSKR